MPYVLVSKSPLLIILIIFYSSSFVKCQSTSIEGIVKSYRDEATWPLQNANLVLIIKNDANHSNIHQLKLNLNQSSFPIHFILNFNEIKRTDNYLLSLLIFAVPHQLLWEGILLRQHLIAGIANTVTFIVHDVSNIPRCLLQGYPCVQSQTVPNTFISVCCSGAKCERSTDFSQEEYKCGGKSPVLLHVNMTFAVPKSTIPKPGPVSQNLIELIRKIFQSTSAPGDLVIIKKVYFVPVRNGTSGQGSELTNDRYVMIIDAIINTPAECREKQQNCQTQTVNKIKNSRMVLAIDQDDGYSSKLTEFAKPAVNFVVMSGGASTIRVPSSPTGLTTPHLSPTRLNTGITEPTSASLTRTTTALSVTTTNQATTSSGTIATQTATSSETTTIQTTTSSRAITTQTTTSPGTIATQTATSSGTITTQTTTSSRTITTQTTTSSETTTTQTTTSSGTITTQTTTSLGTIATQTTTSSETTTIQTTTSSRTITTQTTTSPGTIAIQTTTSPGAIAIQTTTSSETTTIQTTTSSGTITTQTTTSPETITTQTTISSGAITTQTATIQTTTSSRTITTQTTTSPGTITTQTTTSPGAIAIQTTTSSETTTIQTTTSSGTITTQTTTSPETITTQTTISSGAITTQTATIQTTTSSRTITTQTATSPGTIATQTTTSLVAIAITEIAATTTAGTSFHMLDPLSDVFSRSTNRPFFFKR